MDGIINQLIDRTEKSLSIMHIPVLTIILHIFSLLTAYSTPDSQSLIKYFSQKSPLNFVNNSLPSSSSSFSLVFTHLLPIFLSLTFPPAISFLQLSIPPANYCTLLLSIPRCTPSSCCFYLLAFPFIPAPFILRYLLSLNLTSLPSLPLDLFSLFVLHFLSLLLSPLLYLLLPPFLLYPLFHLLSSSSNPFSSSLSSYSSSSLPSISTSSFPSLFTIPSPFLLFYSIFPLSSLPLPPLLTSSCPSSSPLSSSAV